MASEKPPSVFVSKMLVESASLLVDIEQKSAMGFFNDFRVIKNAGRHFSHNQRYIFLPRVDDRRVWLHVHTFLMVGDPSESESEVVVFCLRLLTTTSKH